MKSVFVRAALLIAAVAAPHVAAAQAAASSGSAPNGTAAAPAIVIPAGYTIGADDQLSIVFWRDKEMSADVVVRPDGKISLPLLNDIEAAGVTPDQLRARNENAAAKFISEPTATVVVKQINSRKVYITGNVAKAGTYPLVGDMTVVQLIAVDGGLLEYADSKAIVIMRKENGRDQYFKMNYRDVVRQKNVEQNILLKPGDTVVVP